MIGSPALLFVIVAVALSLVSLLFGHHWGRATVKSQVEEALENERRFADARGFALREQLDEKAAQIEQLKPLAEELARVKEQLEQEQAKYEQINADLDMAFKGSAVQALSDGGESFESLARQPFLEHTQEGGRTLDAKEKAIRLLLQPLELTLRQLDEQTRALELNRAAVYSEIKGILENIGIDFSESLKGESATAAAGAARDVTGESALRRCVELSGAAGYCSFAFLPGDDAAGEAVFTMTIGLATGRSIVVDANVPAQSSPDSGPEVDPALQALRRSAQAQRVKSHLRSLAGPAYWKRFEHPPEFVVCFLPTESLFNAAVEADPSLVEEGAQGNVLMATPVTLVALLRAVGFGWQQAQMTQNARMLQELGRDLYKKLACAHEYFEKMGASLTNAVANFNKLVGAIEGRSGAFFQARKLGALLDHRQPADSADPIVLTTQSERR